MKQNPQISIVMPMYGVEKYISKAIESVLRQTFMDWELLIVNDGTKDNSREIAQKYTQSDERIRIIDKENGGLSDARNFGLREAKGEYIHFFDSDDYVDPDFYESMLKLVDDNDILITGYFVDNIHSAGKSNIIERKCFDATKITGEVESVISECGKYANYAWNKLFRRDFLIRNNLEYAKGLYRIEDVEFMSRVVKYNPRILFRRYAGYHYMVRPETTLSKCYDDKILEHAEARINYDKEVIEFFSPSVNSESLLGRLQYNTVRANLAKLFHREYQLTDKQRLVKIREISSNQHFVSHLRKIEFRNIQEKLLTSLVANRRNTLLFLFGKIR